MTHTQAYSDKYDDWPIPTSPTHASPHCTGSKTTSQSFAPEPPILQHFSGVRNPVTRFSPSPHLN